MKRKISVFVLSSVICLTAAAQNVGIGTTTPAARLHVLDSSVVFSVPAPPINSLAGDPPISGFGRRMMWYADKAAFRVGYVENANWNKENTGLYSFGAGLDNLAIGEGSVSMGISTYAIGEGSVALNTQTYATGRSSFATGIQTNAVGANSAAFGASCGVSVPAAGPP
ncbi:MAG: hypothetical protein EOO03_03055, partial [Chitinophagaceae bacterium]